MKKEDCKVVAIGIDGRVHVTEPMPYALRATRAECGAKLRQTKKFMLDFDALDCPKCFPARKEKNVVPA